MPLTLIGEAVFARCLSAMKEERVAASQEIKAKVKTFTGDKAQVLNDLRAALYASKIVSYAQGYQLMRAAAKTYKWNLNYGGIALVWRGGCIIRSAFLGDIKKAFERNPDLANLLLDKFFKKAVSSRQTGWRRVVVKAGNWASRCPRSARRWRISTATAATGCRPTCCRLSAITSARTPTSAWTNRAASCSTPTGPATAARPPRRRTRRKTTKYTKHTKELPTATHLRGRCCYRPLFSCISCISWLILFCNGDAI